MFLWILKQVILSLINIILIHYLYVFFKTNLTVPKIKDLVNRPVKKYKEIYKSLEREKASPPPSGDMKIELKNYLQWIENLRIKELVFVLRTVLNLIILEHIQDLLVLI